MSFKLFTLTMTLSFARTVSALAQHDDPALHQHHPVQLPDAQIVVTINPEARVSAIIGAPLPPPPACGTSVVIKVKVINQGFVTAPLRVAIAGAGKGHVALTADDTKLSGASEDERLFRLKQQGSELVDVTIVFSIDDSIGDLAGRDRVHLLVGCQSLAQ